MGTKKEGVAFEHTADLVEDASIILEMLNEIR